MRINKITAAGICCILTMLLALGSVIYRKYLRDNVDYSAYPGESPQ